MSNTDGTVFADIGAAGVTKTCIKLPKSHCVTELDSMRGEAKRQLCKVVKVKQKLQ